MQERHSDFDEEDDLLDVFDITEAEPDLLFVNPFSCQVDPLCWRELQVSPAGFEQYLQAKQSIWTTINISVLLGLTTGAYVSINCMHLTASLQ